MNHLDNCILSPVVFKICSLLHRILGHLLYSTQSYTSKTQHGKSRSMTKTDQKGIKHLCKQAKRTNSEVSNTSSMRDDSRLHNQLESLTTSLKELQDNIRMVLKNYIDIEQRITSTVNKVLQALEKKDGNKHRAKDKRKNKHA